MSSFTFPYPFFPVQFTIDGVVFQPAEVDALTSGIQRGVTDLFVISHGWNNNMDDATNLYSGLCAQLAGQIAAAPAVKGRNYAICGILWPSKKFEDQDLIPSGAASLNDAVGENQLRGRVRDLADLIQAKGWPMAGPISGRAVANGERRRCGALACFAQSMAMATCCTTAVPAT